jgi:hypothetical protein
MPLHPSAGAEVDGFTDLTDLFGGIHPYKEESRETGVYIGRPPIERVKRSVKSVIYI